MGRSRQRSDFIEPVFLDMDNFYVFSAHTDVQIFELVSEITSIEQVDRRRTVTGSFFHCCWSKSSCSYEEAFIATASHGTSEVPYLPRAN